MKPTNKLRFVRRAVPDKTFGDNIAVYQHILQQWWGTDPDCEEDFMTQVNGGWRDIPIEEESK